MQKWSKNGVEKYSDCRCEKDHCYAILYSKTSPVLPLLAASYHEVGSFPTFSCFTPNCTPFRFDIKNIDCFGMYKCNLHCMSFFFKISRKRLTNIEIAP